MYGPMVYLVDNSLENKVPKTPQSVGTQECKGKPYYSLESTVGFVRKDGCEVTAGV